MGRVKEWGMQKVEDLAEQYVLQGMDPTEAYERADEEIFGRRYDGPEGPEDCQ